MAIIKCKMCGGDITFTEGKTYGTCEYCGSMVTFPRICDDQRLNLFNRANHFRLQNEFDKAIAAYEKILDLDNKDAEAHWGVVLSRYGIEYVEDPVTHEHIPTCHRVQNTSILIDKDYEAAVSYAPDPETGKLYEAEAARIAEVQKGILAISAQESPFDVFICYKETDDSGNRTKDSSIAQEIYYQLLDEGYKVFFSRITLEYKLGQQYEPYIYAALNSAKVMLVVGTNPDNFNAVWVKNEWSRFLTISRYDRNRLIIPCYRDMNPYELPEELSLFQSQDMSKIGFLQDLIRGIKKVLPKSEQDNVSHSPINDPKGTEASAIDQLTKLHQLYTEGVIDESVYTTQKISLIQTLKQDSLNEESVADIETDNIYIIRDKSRAYGEAKTYIFIDGEKKEAVEDALTISIPQGLHFIWFQRVALTSNTIMIEPQPGKKYHLALEVGMFSLRTVLSEATSEKSIRQNRAEIKKPMEKKSDIPEFSAADQRAIVLLNAAEQKELEKYMEEIDSINAEIDSVSVEYSKRSKGRQKKTKTEVDTHIAFLENRKEAIIEKSKATETRYSMIRSNPAELRKWVDHFMATEGRYQEAQGLMDHKEYRRARDAFRDLGALYDSRIKAEECDQLYREEQYQNAVALQGQKYWKEALSLYKELGEYEDCPARAEQCQKKLGNKTVSKPMDNGAVSADVIIKENRNGNKKKKGFLILCVIFALFGILFALGIRIPDNEAKQIVKNEAVQTSVDYPELVAPSTDFIISRLARVQSIVAVGVVTKEHDPSHQLGKKGGYIDAVFFASSLVDENASKLSEYEVIENGTDGGGCIEIFQTVDDAVQRDSYLNMFNGSILNPGSHKVIGTCIIRTSSKLSPGIQLTLEDAIVNALTEE